MKLNLDEQVSLEQKTITHPKKGIREGKSYNRKEPKPNIMAHTYNPCTWTSDTGEIPQVLCQPRL